MNPRARPLATLVLALMVLPAAARAGDTIDLDRWHRRFLDAIGEEPQETTERRPALGIYATLGGALGPPNWRSMQGQIYASVTDGKHFSIYGGYGEEWGPRANARIFTLGWGGVRPIPVASKQLGFHGKYLRYRRWDDEDHGIHHGLSFGTESGVGFAALAFEVGAARSERNHWMFVAQVALKFAVPIHIPLAKKRAGPPI